MNASAKIVQELLGCVWLFVVVAVDVLHGQTWPTDAYDDDDDAVVNNEDRHYCYLYGCWNVSEWLLFCERSSSKK